MFSCIVQGTPCGKGRPRFTKTGHTYTPGKTADYENKIASEAKWRMLGLEPIRLPVAIEINAFFEIPASWSKKRTAEALDMPHVSKPDMDNIVKLVLDALNGIVYRDDSQVYSITASKFYSGLARLEIRVGV